MVWAGEKSRKQFADCIGGRKGLRSMTSGKSQEKVESVSDSSMLW